MRKVNAFRGKLELKDDIEAIFEKTVTKFGSGAKVDCPKEHLNKRVYLIIRKGGADGAKQ